MFNIASKYVLTATSMLLVANTSESVLGFGLIFPEDVRHSVAVFIGLVVGTVAAYVWEDQNSKTIPKKWLMWQLGMWGLIWVLSLFVAEWWLLSNRAVIALAAGAAFLGRDLIDRARKKALDKAEQKIDEL